MPLFSHMQIVGFLMMQLILFSHFGTTDMGIYLLGIDIMALWE